MKKLHLLLVAILALSVSASAKDGKGKWTGWVTDKACASKVSKEHTADVKCATKCLEGGSPMAFVADSGEVLEVTNPDSLKADAGKHVSVTGEVKNGKLTVAKAALAEKEKGK